MDGDLVLIFGFVLAALWIIFRRPGRLHRRRQEQAPTDPEHEESETARELLEELDRLEERVRVLERIVTDERRDLRSQFRDLEA